MLTSIRPRLAHTVFTSLAFLALGCSEAPPSPASTEAPYQVILVRHAEKAGDDGDVPLTAEGEQRAKDLARTLADAPIERIFVSQYLRNAQTAAPTTAARSLTPITIPADDIEALVTQLRAAEPGSTALVVSHRDKLVEIVERLGASTPPIPDPEYDRIVVLTMSGEGSHLLTLRFGAPTPAAPQQ